MRVSGSGLVFAPSGLRLYIPTTRRRPFQVLPDGEAEAPSGKRSGKDRAAGAAGALHNSCRGAQPGMKKSGQPFEGLPLAANHIGDIDVWNGEIYAGIETFDDGKGENIQVAVYDAGDLTWKRSIDWEPASGQVEVCGLAVDRDRNMVWMADWVDGRYLYGYDLATGKYVRKVHLRPVPQWQQGIYMAGGQMLISADDGDADLDEPDNLYIADLRDGKSYAAVLPFRMMSDFRRAGEIEGLTVDPVTDELLVLSNRGSRIVLGMVRGFYPGYDSELHEVYVYEKVK